MKGATSVASFLFDYVTSMSLNSRQIPGTVISASQSTCIDFKGNFRSRVRKFEKTACF